LKATVQCLRSNFSVALIPDKIVLRETSGADSGIFNKHLVIVGASNARNLIPALQGVGFTITDLTTPGWVATESNIADLITKLQTVSFPAGFGVVLDLLGNASYRFEQFDGTLSLPFKDSAGYHMAGAITVCPDTVYKKIISALTPVYLSAQQNLKVIVPPLPRYLTSGCCQNPSHSTNVNSPGHAGSIITKATHLRTVLKTELLNAGVKNFWLLDSIAGLLGIPPSSKRAGNAAETELVASLNKGVHFTGSAYANMAHVIKEAFHGLAENTLKQHDAAADATGSGKGLHRHGGKITTFFWRGFASPVGIPAAVKPFKTGKYGRERAHPYNKKN
jgi:hypothetical protein